ncbi:GLPGLI family protein [Flavobacterium sp. I-SCBP12n]|uniref:GLPGLI family protein n=1 Tax=Flavobacterium pygoscelis TaxID=2893176 RepID=A0A9X2BL62_9FLAO|nr:GLPGLI family protein [Flavobacterium pygoscelis]MCK8142224.1 GLPGLI family protein [Flavobacterium pygoscelis]
MKNTIIIFLIFFVSSANGQENNISVVYGLNIENEVGLFNNNATLKNLFLKSMIDCKKLNFQLIITQNGSKFYNEKKLEIDGNLGSKSFTLSMGNYTGMIYSIKGKVLKQSPYLGENIYGEEVFKSDWNLTSETKLIDNYLCYKATSSNKVVYGDKVWNHPVVAWYCPKLPFPYGPIGYGNLPGLILELQVRNAIYGVKSINLNSSFDFDVKFLDKIKILTQKQIEEAFTKQEGY